MDTFLPWAAFGAAALAILLAARPWASAESTPDSGTDFWHRWTSARPRYFLAILAAGLVTGLGAWKASDLPGLLPSGYGVLLGCLVAILASVLEMAIGSRVRMLLLPVGLAAAAGGAGLLFEQDQSFVWLGLCFGAPMGALLAGGLWARTAAVLMTAVGAAGAIAAHRQDLARAAGTATLMLTLAVPCLGIANAWSEFASRQSGKRSAFWPGLVAGALLAGGAKLAAAKYLFLNDLFLVGLGAVASAGVVAWLLRDDEETDVASALMASLIWLGWMTIAFGLMKGFGVAVSGVAAGAMLAAVGGRKAWLSLILVVGYSMYRVFLEEYPRESKAIDVGQHYAVMGILAGVALPMLVGNWISALREHGRSLLFTVVAGGVGIAVVLGMTFVIGARGAVGFLTGVSLCAAVLAMGQALRLGIGVLGLCLGSALVIGFRYVSPHIGLDREAKMRVLLYALVGVVALILVAQWILKTEGDSKSHESMA